MPIMPSEGTEPSDDLAPDDLTAEGSPAHAREAGNGPNHAAAEGAPVHPLIDLSRDPNPGVPDHAAHEDS